MDAELCGTVSRDRLGFVAVVEFSLMEDVTECVDVARRVAMRGEAK